MPDNSFSRDDRPTPMPRGFTGGANPTKVVRIIDGNAIYSDRYDDGFEGSEYRSEYNAHEPEATDDMELGQVSLLHALLIVLVLIVIIFLLTGRVAV